MDEETASLIDALRHPGAALLLGLFESEATEDELRRHVPDLSQPAVNRKLAQLAEKRLIYRESGSRQKKGLLWGLVFREETEAFQSAANVLAGVGVERRRAQVAATQQRLARARAERDLREIS